MYLMAAPRSGLSLSQAGLLTVDDLRDTPDDARRYELIDGILLVSPEPVARHQRAAMRLGTALHLGCPEGFEAFGPFTLRLARDTEQPSVAVYELLDGAYVLAALVSGDESFDTTMPPDPASAEFPRQPRLTRSGWGASSATEGSTASGCAWAVRRSQRPEPAMTADVTAMSKR